MANEIIVIGPDVDDSSSTDNKPDSKLELAIAAWLDAKSKRSNSSKTLVAYRDTLASFRAVLLAAGLDLDTSDITTLALAAQGWAGQSTAAAPSFIKEEEKINAVANNPDFKTSSSSSSSRKIESQIFQIWR